MEQPDVSRLRVKLFADGAEIAVIQSFMPAQIEGEALEGAVKAVIGEVGAKDIKDMGRTMAALKQRYPGRMDFAKASAMVRQALV